MDVCFELLLLDKQPLNNLEYSQKSITWGGTIYPQEPKKYIWGKYISLIETAVPHNLYQYLPGDFHIECWTCLSIGGQILNILESEVNGKNVDWEGKTLKSLMKLILEPQEKWVAVFEWQCDKINAIYYLDIDECVLKIQNNLESGKIREGFIVMYPPQDNIRI
jgi:hypothetical protein